MSTGSSSQFQDWTIAEWSQFGHPQRLKEGENVGCKSKGFGMSRNLQFPMSSERQNKKSKGALSLSQSGLGGLQIILFRVPGPKATPVCPIGNTPWDGRPANLCFGSQRPKATPQHKSVQSSALTQWVGRPAIALLVTQGSKATPSAVNVHFQFQFSSFGFGIYRETNFAWFAPNIIPSAPKVE